MRVHFSLLLLATTAQVASSANLVAVPGVGTDSKGGWWKVKNGKNNGGGNSNSNNNNNNNKRGDVVVWSMEIRRLEHPVVMATIMIEQITEGMLDHDLIEGTP